MIGQTRSIHVSTGLNHHPAQDLGFPVGPTEELTSTGAKENTGDLSIASYTHLTAIASQLIYSKTGRDGS
jgi:hypothetical protein